MDWRRPIDQQKPVSSAALGRSDAVPRIDFVGSAEYRAADRNPDHIELAIRARAYRERSLREGRRLI